MNEPYTAVPTLRPSPADWYDLTDPDERTVRNPAIGTGGADQDEIEACLSCQLPRCDSNLDGCGWRKLVREKEAAARTGRKGRDWHRKITADQARDIYRRGLAGEPTRVLAEEYDLDPSTIRSITTGRSWRQATGALR